MDHDVDRLDIALLQCNGFTPIDRSTALKSRSTTLKTSSKPLILHRQNETWQEIRAVKLLPSVTARILAEFNHPFFLKRNSKNIYRTKDRTRTKNMNRTGTLKTQNHTPTELG